MNNLETKTWLIYKHTLIADCDSKGKSYIGLTSRDAIDRWGGSGYGYKGQVFYLAIEKYGWENFSHEILEDNIPTLEEANKREIYWISYYHTWKDDPECWGYNVSQGGEAFYTSLHHSSEAKFKIAEAMRARVVSAETKKKISKSKLGHSVSKEQIDKWKESFNAWLLANPDFKPGPQSIESRKALSQAKLGKKLSDETKEKLRQANLGKASKSKLNKPVICIETGIIYPTIKAAATATGAKRENIRLVLKGKRHKAGGYHWKYYTDSDLNI